jgi:tRNA A-37 threonylcarbamoyl transferase component Bud32
MSATSEHPPRKLLEGYSLGCLDDEAMASVEEHLAACPTCAAVADETQDDEFCRLLRKHGAELFETPRSSAVDLKEERSGLNDRLRDAPAQRWLNEIRPAFASHTSLRLESVLDQGGMGIVFTASNVMTDERVAVKTIRPDLLDRLTIVERFVQEIRTVAKVASPYVVQQNHVDSIRLPDGRVVLYSIMQLVPGERLDELVERCGPLDFEAAIPLFRQAVFAVQAMFKAGVVHRDIKPQNCKVSADGNLKLLDFGLGRVEQDGDRASLSTTGDFLGTVDYVSPEQALKFHDADVRSDIYSLGCTFFFALVGHPPFPHGNAVQKLADHRDTPPPEFHKLRPEIPQSLSNLVNRMLAKSPDQRFQKPEDILTALDDAERQVVAIRTGQIKRRRWTTFLLAAAFVFMVATVIVYRIQTDFGEVEITGSHAHLRVRVQDRGRTVRILDRSGEAVVRLPTGSYQLTLLDGDSEWELVNDEIILRRDSKEFIRVRRRAASTIATDKATPGIPIGATVREGTRTEPPAPTAPRLERNRWYDLLEHVDVRQHTVKGPWRKTSSGLQTDPERFSRIAIPFIPTGSYEFQARFSRDEGSGEINFTIPVAGRCCQFTLDQETNWPSLDFVRGSSLRSVREFRITNHREYELRVVVTAQGDRAAVRIELDQQPCLAWTGAVGELDHTDFNWWIPENSLSFGVHNSDAVLKQFEIRLLDGDLVKSGTFVEAEALSKESWIDLLSLVNLQHHNSRGSWTNGQDGLRVRGNEFSRVLLPIETHGSFEVDLAMTWECGKDEVNCIFPVGRGSCMLSFAEMYQGLQYVWGGVIGKPFYSTSHRDPFQSESYDVLLRLEQNPEVIHISVDVNKHRHVDCRLPQWDHVPANQSPVVMRNDWSLPHHAFGIGAHRDIVHFKRARFRPLDDRARILRYDPGQIVSAPPEESEPQPSKDPASRVGDQIAAKQGHGLIGEYHAGVNFGRLLLTRVDPQVDWFWGNSAPAGEHPADDFSVRWTGWLKAPRPGRYRLVLMNDDGVRLWLDDRLIIDDWTGHLVTRNEVEVDLTASPHRLRLDYFEVDLGSAVSLRWRELDGFDEQPIPTAALFTLREAAEKESRFTPEPQPNAVIEERFTGRGFARLVERRNSAAIAWTQPGSISRPLWEQGISIRWTTRLLAPKPGQYQFIVAVDDGVRLWLDNQLLIDDWNDGEMRRLESSIVDLTTNPANLRVEYFNNPETNGVLSLRWRQIGGFTEHEIPANAYRPTP